MRKLNLNWTRTRLILGLLFGLTVLPLFGLAQPAQADRYDHWNRGRHNGWYKQEWRRSHWRGNSWHRDTWRGDSWRRTPRRYTVTRYRTVWRNGRPYRQYYHTTYWR